MWNAASKECVYKKEATKSIPKITAAPASADGVDPDQTPAASASAPASEEQEYGLHSIARMDYSERCRTLLVSTQAGYIRLYQLRRTAPDSVLKQDPATTTNATTTTSSVTTSSTTTTTSSVSSGCACGVELHLVKELAGEQQEILDLVFLRAEHAQQNTEQTKHTDHMEHSEYLLMACNSNEMKLLNTRTFDCRLVPAHGDMVISLALHSSLPLLASTSKVCSFSFSFWFL